MMLRAAIALLDALIIAIAAAIVGIILAGGVSFQLVGHHVTARSVGNPLIAFYALLALRLAIRGLSSAETASRRICVRAWRHLSELSERDVLMLVSACILVSAGLKTFNAIAYFGFYSGDDVEIHEMTFSRLFGLSWRAWELRNSFYPMTFIYPVQSFCLRLGVSDPARLVAAGRMVVVSLSSLTLAVLFQTGRRHYGVAAAVLAVVLLAFSKIHVTFGGSELPRPVATLFLCLAFAAILSGRSWSAAAAGILLGIGAALRFSEAVFLVPAVAQLALARRFRDATIVGILGLATAAAILGASDSLYWGSPFFSLKNIVDYTVVRRLSSRGYEPFYYYVTHLNAWSNVFVVALAIYAIRIRAWPLVLWTFAPICILSLLPHKEARYLIPITPFLALAAAVSLSHLLERLSNGSRYLALILVVGFTTSLLFEAGGFRFRRSEDGVRVARFLAAQPDVRGVVAEQLWRLGGWIYLKGVPTLIDIAPESVADHAYVWSAVTRPDVRWVALERRDYARFHHESWLGREGFVEARLATEEYVLLGR